ncbi:MAG: hypothetical protein CFE45_20110 [Burkholderiales bacterium PBB5]|nr:MAG: hypothetical protein CFE45_20110 [Burkholderiales bacterium PBB5]
MDVSMTGLRDWRRLVLRVVAPVAVVAAVLAACGGGTSQAVAYAPKRLVVLGDESSMIVDDGVHNGRKYSVNYLDSTGARSCGEAALFTQAVATRYGFVFAECNTGGAPVSAVIRAKVGAKVADAVTGMAQQIAEGALGPDDLVTVYFGTNDLVEIYELYASNALTRAGALAEAQSRGRAAADQFNKLLATGARALLFLAPELGLSPYAIAKNAGDPGAKALLSELTYQFNGHLRTNIDAQKYDGRNYGLIITDDIVSALVAAPSGSTLYLASPYDVTTAECVVALPNCTTAAADLVSGGLYNSHLWADDRRLGYPGHALLANRAVSLLRSLPL